MNTSEPVTRHRRARHLAPKPRPHTTTPSVKPVPVAYRTPTWDIFEPEGGGWDDADLFTQLDRKVA